MSNEINRRNFMKSAGAAAAGVTIAAGWSPFSYAANERVRVGCIGTGGQGTFHVREGMAGTPDIEIAAICDIYEPFQRGARIFGTFSNAGIGFAPGEDPKDATPEMMEKARSARQPKGYYDYKEMLDREELDAVVIGTPLDLHYQMCMDALDAGKYVFCEKTLVQTVEQGRDLAKKCHEVGKWIQVGHQRRYNPKYNLAMSIAHEKGWLGRINHITSQWHRNHYWRRIVPPDVQLNEQEKKFIKDLDRHFNWRMYEDRSGGLYTELATHQTDISNWFLMNVPSRVYATSGLDYWRDGREVDDNIVIVYEYDQRPGQPGFQVQNRRSKLQNLAMLNKPYTVRFVYTSILANAKRGASELIQGDWGTLELSELDCYLYGEPAAMANYDKAPAEGDIQSGASLNVNTEALEKGVPLLADRELESADVYQFRAFADCIKNGGVPRNNHMVGFTTAITAIAAMESRDKGAPVDIDPEWYAFDFDVPSFHEWEWDEEEQGLTNPMEVKPAEEGAVGADGQPVPAEAEGAAPAPQQPGQPAQPQAAPQQPAQPAQPQAAPQQPAQPAPAPQQPAPAQPQPNPNA